MDNVLALQGVKTPEDNVDDDEILWSTCSSSNCQSSSVFVPGEMAGGCCNNG